MDWVIRPIMGRHGFTLSFNMESKDGGGAVVTGTLLHRDGHSKSASVPLALDAGAGRNNLQAMGSTLAYGKRYCAEMLLNIVRKSEDDDGVSGGKRLITADQVKELAALCEQSGRVEVTLLERMFSGLIHSFEEVEVGQSYVQVKNMLQQIIAQRAKADKGVAP